MAVLKQKEDFLYFSKRLKKKFEEILLEKDLQIFVVKLNSLEYPEEEIESLIQTMFAAWKRIVDNRQGAIGRYKGIMRRFFVEYDKEKKMYRGYMYLICIRNISLNWEEYKVWLRAHVSWLTAWCSAMGFYSDEIVPKVEGITDEGLILKILNNFFWDKKYSFNSELEERQEKMLKDYLLKHQCIGFSGVFRKALRNLKTIER